MARGWESKAVESQIEAASSKAKPAVQVSAAELSRRRELESLQLSRTRVLHDLGSASNPRYRQSLEAALKFLDEKIAALLDNH